MLHSAIFVYKSCTVDRKLVIEHLTHVHMWCVSAINTIHSLPVSCSLSSMMVVGCFTPVRVTGRVRNI